MNAAPLSSNQNKTQPYGRGELVLVVDSDRSVLDMASIIFELGGYRVITTDNSMQAFEIYEKKSDRIQAVLLDVSMPIMDGIELSSILVDINPEVKIIVSSKQDVSYNELKLRNLGVRHFLSKPYDVSQLLRTIYNVIHQDEATE